ncbi:hypothetical protein CNR27_08765 [Luteimonas chenhongjianii]|uniref:Uncharacterized protein n=1 Tax=Luteimonas chenhongjianii TaxID=2006110 RepID=A0A290XEE9_9GAMM|nr:hypothetical protein [Luteimonas chenhongjianii]ATD67515.1 hypothetical protein CNR27_08765 [Luteimonas chenhongjianii]
MSGTSDWGERAKLYSHRRREVPADRLPELQRFAAYGAKELRSPARSGQSREEPNLLVLGDFNIG